MSVDSVFLATARVSYGATDLTTAYPHGGTALGICSRIEVEPAFRSFEVKREEEGSPEKVFSLGGDMRVRFVLDEWDETSLAQFWPRTRTATGSTVLQFPPTVTGLTALSPLVFTPYRTDTTLPTPGVVVFTAYVMPDPDSPIHQSAVRHLRLPFMAVGQPNSSGLSGEMGPITKLATS